MTRLREASLALARKAAHPVLSAERLFAIERAAAAFGSRRIRQRSDWAELADRATDDGVDTLSAVDLRRLLAGIWTDRLHGRLAEPCIERLLLLRRRSADRALIAAYLLAYPVDHPAFAALRDAAVLAADRHAWRCRDAGRQWRLWDGPTALGEALGRATDPRVLLCEAGLVGRLADGAFVSAARADAARSAR